MKYKYILSASAFVLTIIFIFPFTASAWSTKISGDSFCLTTNKAALRFSFTNTERLLPLNVTAKDSQTGLTINLGNVVVNQTKSGEITTSQTSLKDGKITFEIFQNEKKEGKEIKTVSYEGIICTPPQNNNTENNTPTPTTAAAKTATPTPTKQMTPTPTKRVVNIITPTPTPTHTTAVSNIQSPSSTKQLPSTGTPFEALYILGALLPTGIALRKFSQK